jgi:glutathione S-transferase
MSIQPLRFITLPISHYCEKVRWALDRQRVPYREEKHAPLLHALATLPATGFRTRTVPVLIDENPGVRHVLADSTDCLRYLASRYGAAWLYEPAEAAVLEEQFDAELGPHTRRFAYFHILPETGTVVPMLMQHAPPLEARITRPLFPLIRRLMRKGMRIDAAGAERSLAKVRQQLEQVSERLRDGRRYLCGDTLSAADISFAALAVPVILPRGYGGIDLPDLEAAPPLLRAEIERARKTPAGELVLRLYAEERRK